MMAADHRRHSPNAFESGRARAAHCTVVLFPENTLHSNRCPPLPLSPGLLQLTMLPNWDAGLAVRHSFRLLFALRFAADYCMSVSTLDTAVGSISAWRSVVNVPCTCTASSNRDIERSLFGAQARMDPETHWPCAADASSKTRSPVGLHCGSFPSDVTESNRNGGAPPEWISMSQLALALDIRTVQGTSSPHLNKGAP